MPQESFMESTFAKQDETFERPLRPLSLDDFSGQPQVRERLEVIIGAAKMRGESLGHCLFSGPPGLGKTTLSHIISRAMGTNLTVLSGPVIEKPGDLAGVLTGLGRGDVLFIDEIHRLSRSIEEYLYPAMEDFVLDLMIDSGPSARSVKVNLNPFTLVGATTRSGMISSPLRSRFESTFRLDYYPAEVLLKIVLRAGSILKMELDSNGAMEIAKRARGTPRIANNLLRWVRDYAQIKAQGKKIGQDVVSAALEMISVDHKGLDELDTRVLEVLIDYYGGGPVGLSTLAATVGEEPSTIEEVVEPFLILQGFIKRTPRGREATPLAYAHLQREMILNEEET
jgi:Holliday junction DNA helicase RuvB